MSKTEAQAVASDALFGVWMPIETAPKDGTRIMVCDETDAFVVAWIDGKTTRRDHALMQWAIPESWQDEQGGYYSIDNPLAWMPLPNLPNPSHHDGAATAPSVDGAVRHSDSGGEA